MKKEDLRNVPEEIILKAVEAYLEAERTISRWKSSDEEPSYDMPDNLRFLLNCINDRAEFAALIDVMADEAADFRILRFPSRKVLEASVKRQAVEKYARLKESGGYDYTWEEIAALSGVGSIGEARRYYEQAKESKANKSDRKKEKKLIDLTLKFIIQTVKIEKGYI